MEATWAQVTADFTVDFPTACSAPHIVQFTDNSTGSIISYQWDFGNGFTGSAANPSTIYASPGSYNVTLIVSDGITSDTLVRTAYIQVANTSPSASFTSSAQQGCAPWPVNFTNTSTDATSYLWNFGDGNTSTASNPTHTYTTDGTYTVKLYAYFGDGSNGCVDSLIMTDYITVDFTPTIPFTVQSNTSTCQSFLFAQFAAPLAGVTWQWDFGDGQTSSSPPPINHPYIGFGSYDLSVIATTGGGCSDTVFMPDLIQLDTPHVAISSDITSGCSPLTVNFQDATLAVDNITSWLWDFGDGNTSTAPNPMHTYTDTGSYNVTLTVNTSTACTHTLTMNDYITIGPPIQGVGFLVVPEVACAIDPIVFFNTSTTSGNVNWLWDVGEGSLKTGFNASHFYQDTGYFDVSLIAENSFGCRDTLTQANAVRIIEPVALFSINPAISCAAPAQVQFLDESIGATSWLWDFGDSTTATTQNPTHTYALPGTYTIVLRVNNAITGCDDETELTITIPEPEADFVASEVSGCTDFTVFFGNDSRDTENYLWNFGDGTTSTNVTPSHTYTSPGVYDVQLISIDSLGCSDTLTRTSYISVGSLNTDFAVSSLNGCAPFTVNFSDLSSFAPTGTADITNWYWSFGDGDTSTAQNPTHTYTTPGNYTISLVTQNALGCIDTLIRTDFITISGPTAKFIPSVTADCAPLPVVFTDSSEVFPANSPIIAWNWDFGDGATSIDQNASHVYTTPGIYDVTLVVTDNQGCRDTLTFDNLMDICTPLIDAFTCDSLLDCSVGSLGDVDISNVDTGEVLIWDGLMFTTDILNVDDADADNSNELQDLTQSGNTISLSNSASSIDLTMYLDDTDDQTLSWDSASQSLSITGGNSVTLTGVGNGSSSTSSVWGINGTDTYYSSGAVGIGTDSPDAKVDIEETDLGTKPAIQIDAADNNAPNGYSLEIKGHPSAGGNGHHVQLTTASDDSRLTLKAGDDSDFAPRLQMTGAGEVSSAGWAIFDYGSRIESLPDASFKMRFMPTTGAPVDMVHADGSEGVYLAPTAGRVGIGTNAPATLLHVAGEIRSDDLIGGGNVIADANGNLVLGAASNDNDITNELLSSVQLNGSTLEISDAGGNYSVDLSAISGVGSADSDWQFVGSGSNLSDPIYRIGDIGIGTSTPIAKLEVQNGAVLFDGTTGSTPISGAGTRMMWVPEKAALRAGAVIGPQWDDANIGIYSTAIGFSGVASGTAATAIGRDNNATGQASTAIGRDNNATADGATAIGRNNEASGEGSTAIGFSTIASGFAATTMGISTEASGDFSLAIGSATKAIGFNSVATGIATTASGNYATAMGQSSQASGDNSTAMGIGTQTSFGALAIGRYNDDGGSSSAWMANDYAFSIGDGMDSLSRSNAMYVKKNGDVWIQGSLTQFSDRRLKQEIRPLEDVMQRIRQLDGVTYQWKNTDLMGEEREIGFIAQELQKVFPELVEEVEGYKAVNYIGLVPVLLEGIKSQDTRMTAQEETIATQQEMLLDQQATIHDLHTELAEIKQMLAFLGLQGDADNTSTGSTQPQGTQSAEPTNESRLYQNKPNPFNQQTELPYFLVEGTTSAEIVVYELLSGKIIERYPIEGHGYGRIYLSADDMPAGVYIYSLKVQGIEVDTRRMVLVD